MGELAPPSQAAPLGDGYSNYDHEFDIPEAELAERLRAGAVAPHSAWDHWGTIWWQDENFHEEVRVHGSVQAVITRTTLSELVTAVNDEYGDS